jgi:2-methylcitrate dehydratase PrpD
MTDPEHGKSPPARVNPAALAVADAARLLAKAGGEPVTEAMIAADIRDGAPTNPDGTVNLVHYAAWLALKTREDAGG